jgi:hypothetical protein
LLDMGAQITQSSEFTQRSADVPRIHI